MSPKCIFLIRLCKPKFLSSPKIRDLSSGSINFERERDPVGEKTTKIGAAAFGRRTYKGGAAAFGRRPPL